MKRTFNTPSVKIVMFSAETVHTASILPAEGKYAYENAIGSIDHITVQAYKNSEKLIEIIEMKK